MIATSQWSWLKHSTFAKQGRRGWSAIHYVSERNLQADLSGAPLRHPRVSDLFIEGDDGRYHELFLQEH